MTVEALRRRRPQTLADLLETHGREIQAVAYLILRELSKLLVAIRMLLAGVLFVVDVGFPAAVAGVPAVHASAANASTAANAARGRCRAFSGSARMRWYCTGTSIVCVMRCRCASAR